MDRYDARSTACQDRFLHPGLLSSFRPKLETNTARIRSSAHKKSHGHRTTNPSLATRSSLLSLSVARTDNKYASYQADYLPLQASIKVEATHHIPPAVGNTMGTLSTFQGLTLTLVFAVLTANSGTSFHFGYASGVL